MLKNLPVKDLYPSPHNNRTSFEVTTLAESIKTQGLIEPIVVRRLACKDGEYEIVCGERRWRAHIEAGLDTIAAMVRELSDEDARAITLTENMQREDLSPLEQAEGVQSYLDMGWDIARIASQLGQNRTWVASRANLCKLTDFWKTELNEVAEDEYRMAVIPQYPIRHLEAVAKLSPDEQDGLLKILNAKSYVPSYAELTRQIEERTRPLKKAPFPMDWKVLKKNDEGKEVVHVADCESCPMRQGAAPDLFGITSRVEAKDDKCQSSKCYKRKAILWSKHKLSLERQKTKESLESSRPSSELVLDLRRHIEDTRIYYTARGVKSLEDEQFEKCLKADDNARKGMCEGTLIYVLQVTDKQAEQDKREKTASKNDLESAVRYAHRQQTKEVRKSMRESLNSLAIPGIGVPNGDTTTVVMTVLGHAIDRSMPLQDAYEKVGECSADWATSLIESQIDHMEIPNLQFLAFLLKISDFDEMVAEAQAKHPYPQGQAAQRFVTRMKKAA